MQEQKVYTYMSLYDEITSILNQVICVASRYNHDTLRDQMKTMIENINNMRHTRIVLVGNFATGKSSILNALLGEQVTPTYYLASHCMPCIVKYGNESEILLHFNKEISQNNLESLPASVREHIRVNSEVPIPSLSIKIDEIENYTSFDILQKCQNYLPYSAVEVRLTNDFLRNDVEIVEFPGIGYNVVNSVTCIEQLNADDIVIMTMSACHLCSMSEMDFIEYQLKERSITPIFVITYFDSIRAERDRDLVRKFAQMKLSSYSPYEILFVSTNQGIESIEENDKAAYVKSNIESLKILLSSIIRQRNLTFLNHLIEEMRRKIHPYILLTDSKNDTIDFQETEKLSIIKTYNELNHKRQFILGKTKLTKERDIHELKHSAHRYFCFLAEQIPHWIYSYTPPHQLGIPSEANIMRLVQEITNYIENKIRNNIQEWSAGDLNKKFKQMSLSYKLNIEDFFLKLYKDLNDNYPSRAINMITSYRTAQIKEGLLIKNELPHIIRNCEMDDFPCVNIIGLIGCTLVPLTPKQIIERIKKEVSTCYCEYITKESTGFISNIISAVNSHFDEFNHIISNMIQEDIEILEYYNTRNDKLATAIVQYKDVQRRLESYIARLPTSQR